MNEREYWRPHVRSKRFPAIRYAAPNAPATPGSYIRITCRGERASGQENIEVENEVSSSKRQGNSMAALPQNIRKKRFGHPHKSSESLWLPSVRSVPACYRLREIPGIYVSPAPKCSRKTTRSENWNAAVPSKTYYHRTAHGTRNTTSNLATVIPSGNPPVTIPQLNSEIPHNGETSDDQKSVAEIHDTADKVVREQGSHKETNAITFCPKLVNLNHGFMEISSKFGHNVALNVALSRQFAASKRFPDCETYNYSPRSRNTPYSPAPRYLPLRQVYLKGALSDGKDAVPNDQEEKNSRIWSWLKKLNYLDSESSNATERIS